MQRRRVRQLHDQHVVLSKPERVQRRRPAPDLVAQPRPLSHAEAMLLIDNGQRQILEDHLVLDQRVGADQQVDLAVRQTRDDLAAFLAFLAAGENG
ncbi:MAG TPA: hypothetical protein PKC20_09460, partial [Burkholderiaceae bacterium]|nr:hypothetical protein [Burkholderiaceae bacterium]